MNLYLPNAVRLFMMDGFYMNFTEKERGRENDTFPLDEYRM